MASRVAVAALVLVVLVGTGELVHGHAVPLGRAKVSLGWMNGMEGGPPSGMRPSTTAATNLRRRIGEEGSRHVGVEEDKFDTPTSGFKLPPLPPTARGKEDKFVAPVPGFKLPPLPPTTRGKENKFVSPVPGFKRPPLPPTARGEEDKFTAPVPGFKRPPLPPTSSGEKEKLAVPAPAPSPMAS